MLALTLCPCLVLGQEVSRGPQGTEEGPLVELVKPRDRMDWGWESSLMLAAGRVENTEILERIQKTN